VPLGELAEVIPGVATRTAPPQGDGRRDRVLTVRALSEHGIEADGVQQLEVLGRIVDAQRLRPGDVLLPARSTRVVAAVVPPDLAGVPINATLVIVRCGPLLSPQVLAAYLNHPEGQLAVAAVAQSGTAQINLTATALRRLPVPTLPRGRQDQLAEVLGAAQDAYSNGIEAATARLHLARTVALAALTRRCTSNTDGLTPATGEE